jgi:hypothetical protein
MRLYSKSHLPGQQEFVHLYGSSEVTTFKATLKDKGYVLLGLRYVEWQHFHPQTSWVYVLHVVPNQYLGV